jgi:dihydrolipoamide dehydrogenase
MADVREHELVVLGGGPGGYAAAFLAADKGLAVTLVDEADRLGGTCLRVGCIPSKALLHTAKLITDARDAARFGVTFGEPKIDVGGVRKHWLQVVDTLTGGLATLARKRNVKVIKARGRFADGQSLQLADGSRLRFKHCILATGSVPARPGPLQVDSPLVMTSTEALQLEGVPGSLLVVGGGYIGLELGYVYAALGCPVTVVEMTAGLLPGVDRDLVKPLHDRLGGMFKGIHLDTQVTKLEPEGKGVRAHLQGEEVGEAAPVFDRVLVAVGRRPSSQDLGLETTRVQVDGKGFVQVDEQRRTAEERIFAIGDVAGEPMLAHKATYEGKVAVEAILGERAVMDNRAVPAVVFTDPEIAWAGLTETDAKKTGRAVEVARFPWAASGRALSLGRPEGLTKLVVDPDTEIVLGVGIVGVDAGEMIGEAMLAIEMGASARDLALTMHAHPTLSETILGSAEVLHGTATDLYRPKKR